MKSWNHEIGELHRSFSKTMGVSIMNKLVEQVADDAHVEQQYIWDLLAKGLLRDVH